MRMGGCGVWVVRTGHRQLLDGKLRDAVNDFLEKVVFHDIEKSLT